jgi:hypothetical protein
VPDTGLPALGRAFDEFLRSRFSPPPGTDTVLGFVPGVPVDPTSFDVAGVTNPLAVQTFLEAVVGVLGPVADGRFAGALPARSVYGAVIEIARPLDPPDSAAAAAFTNLQADARSAFGFGTEYVTAVPDRWFDPVGGAAWNSFSARSTEVSQDSESTGTGTPSPEPPRPLPTHPGVFERMWRWRTLDPERFAEVVLDPAPPPGNPPPVEEFRMTVPRRVVLGDAAVQLEETSVRERVVVGGRSAEQIADLRERRGGRTLRMTPVDAPEGRLLVRAPRAQLADALQGFVREDVVDPVDRAERLRDLVRVKAPTRVEEVVHDGEATSSVQVESTDLTLSLDYTFVQISRAQWWNDVVLRMPRWYVPGTRAREFSTTTGLADLPLCLPIAMVVTRNVEVRGTWSDVDVESARSGASLGPWSTGSSSFEREEQTLQAALRIPGMQVVAVVCAVLPPLAPADDPALGPVEPPVVTQP